MQTLDLKPLHRPARREMLRHDATALRSPSGPHVKDLLTPYLAVQFADVLSAEQCARFVRGVYGARRYWIENFGGAQYTLGRAWYTDLEQDRVEAYFDGARRSDAIVEAACPGLRATVFELTAALLRAPVVQRADWCGPGIHVFPAGRDVAAEGGDVHFDTEGLSDEQKARRAATLTIVLMLQPPEHGGGLRVWDRRWEGEQDDDAIDPHDAGTVVAEAHVADLTVIDSYTLHQIQPFTGARDRISLTAHAVFESGRWELWF